MTTVVDGKELTSELNKTFTCDICTKDWLISEKVLPETIQCSKLRCCGVIMTLTKAKEEEWFYRCPECRKKQTIRRNTPFYDSKLKLKSIWHIFLCFWLNLTQLQASYLTGVGKNAILYWYRFARRACAVQLFFRPKMIGGPGVIVEIDEAVWRRRKYHKGFPEP